MKSRFWKPIGAVIVAVGIATSTVIINQNSGTSGGGGTDTLNCMPNPSACGYPDLDGPVQVGVQPGHTLTPVSGNVNLTTNGQVYQDKIVTDGQITVTGNNVTIQNVKVVRGSDFYGILITEATGLTVSHVEFDRGGILGGGAAGGEGDWYGVAFSGYHGDHLYFHNGSDCAGVAIAAQITDSLCSVGKDANNDGWPDGGSYDAGGGLSAHPGQPANPDSEVSYCNGGTQHFDGFQSDGGNGINISHNTIRNVCSQTSAILMSSNSAAISNITINNNLVAGGAYTIFCAGDDNAANITNETMTNNHVSRIYWTPDTQSDGGGYYGPFGHCGVGLADTFSGNIFDDTGETIGR